MDSPGKDPAKSSIEIPDVRTLNILYTNDIQGNAEQMSYLSTVVKRVRNKESFTLLVDSGNWAKGTLLSDSFKGMPIVEIMNVIKYDAVNIGEGEIAFGNMNLYNLHDKSSFCMLSCNIMEESTGISPYFLKKFVIIKKGPFKVAVVGIALPGSCTDKGFIVKDPFTLLPDVLKEVEDNKPDVIVLLSRMGIEGDRALARAFPALNVIIGGRDRKFLDNPIIEGQTFICQAGEKAKYLGSLAFDIKTTIKISSAD
jgi:2',3'-cyclic-nucleotide 2'-phosphodiesterase (5'-nucleotidase family)